jgi:flotillin
MNYIVVVILVAVLFIFIVLFSLIRRYKRCPSDRILVVFGKVGKASDKTTLSARCIHGGAAFIWPIIQDYAFLDLTPQSIEVNLTNALSKQNIRVDVPSRFTIGISTEPGIMENAAERLLGLSKDMVHNLALDIIFGQLRLVVATMDIEEINNNRDKFLTNVSSNVELELKKVGLKLINVNLTDIRDESGYIEALGKEAAAKAINDAKKSVAEKNRDGQIGEAIAMQDQRIKVSDANAMAVE